MRQRSSYYYKRIGKENIASCTKLWSKETVRRLLSNPICLYAKEQDKCTVHYIRTCVLNEIVLGELNKLLMMVRENENEFILIEMDYGQYEGTDLRNMPEERRTFFSDFVRNPAPNGM